jgi:hypothetical protein
MSLHLNPEQQIKKPGIRMGADVQVFAFPLAGRQTNSALHNRLEL